MSNIVEKRYRTGIYLRLSRGDNDVDQKGKSESNSITNQRTLLEDYINSHKEFELVECFIDDGWSGSNFVRPEFQSMIQAVDDGKINCIIVKDLSRFGREYIGTGTYISKKFKEKNVRFIAVNDNYDTLTANSSESSVIMPVKNLINDSFCKDISTKVRSSQLTKRLKGEFIGAFAVYGYMKSPENKNQLVVDEYAAGIVQKVFAKKLRGMSASAIAIVLNEIGILAPSEYKKKMGFKYSTSFKGRAEAKWSAQTVGRILKNAVYIGILEQGKSAKVSYKVDKEIVKPKSEWIRIEEAQEAIISKRDFNAVQILMNRDTKAANGKHVSYMYAGLLYCGDCGMSLVRRSYSYKSREIVSYICSNYNRNGKCSRHNIREEILNEIVLGELQSYIKKMCDCSSVIEHIDELNINFAEAVSHDKEIAKLKAEALKYSTLKSSLYGDLKEGLISEEQFNQYRNIFSNKVVEIEASIREQEKIIRNIYDSGMATGERLDFMRENVTIDMIDRIALVTFIDRILIYDDDTVEIMFKYKNEMEKVAGIIESSIEIAEHHKVSETEQKESEELISAELKQNFVMYEEESFEPDYYFVNDRPIMELREVS